MYNVFISCSHEREVDPKTKSSSLPVPRSAAYRLSTNSQQPGLPAVLQLDSPQQVLSTTELGDRQPKAYADENRQTLHKRIQLLQDHNLKLLSHIKVFREAIDKVNNYVYDNVRKHVLPAHPSNFTDSFEDT